MIGTALLAVTIVTAPLLCGSARPWAIAPLCAVALAAFWTVRRSKRGVRIDPVVAVGLVLLAATVLQAVPLPDSVVRAISPTAWEIERGALGPLAASADGWKTLSLSPNATWIEVAKVALLVLVYCVARDVAARSPRPIVSELVAVSGVLVAFVGVAHSVLGAQAIYGWYRPAGVQAVVGPFVNGNHQAAVLALGAAASVGLALGGGSTRRRVLWVAALALALLGGVLAGARAGIVVIVLALLGSIGLRFAGRGRIPRWLPAAVIGVILIVAVARGDRVIEVFSDTDTKKLEVWKPAPDYLRSFWAAGAGRGAFPVAYKRFQQLPDDKTYTHVENVPLQMVLDYGVPLGGLLLLVSGGALAWLFLRRHASSHDAAATAGLAALALHNLVDFNLEISGVAVPAVALLGSLAVPRGEVRHHPRAPGSVIGGMCALVAGLGLFIGVRGDIRNAEGRVRAAAARQTGFREAITPALLQHPADHVLPLLAARYEMRHGGVDGERRPLSWVNRALQLFPGSFDAHLLAARWLAQAGRESQSVLEYRMAIDARPAQVEAIVREAANRWQRFESLRELARDRDARLMRWNLLATILDKKGTRLEAKRADEALIEIDPSHAKALARRAWRALEDGRHDDAMRRADALRAVDAVQADHVRGRALLRDQRVAEAVEALARAAEARPADPVLWLDLARAAHETGDANRVRTAVERARRVIPEGRGGAGLELQAGAILENAGQAAAALRAYHRAAKRDPGLEDAWRRVLRLSQRLGEGDLVAEARRALGE